MITFHAETYQNEFLPIGGTSVNAIVTVDAAGDGTSVAEGVAVVVVLDASASMRARRKLTLAREAAIAAVDQVRDGALFAVLAGSHSVQQVYPRTNEPLAAASMTTRAEAAAAIARVEAEGGTAIGRWLRAAAQLLRPFEGFIRHVILLTDGRDESETPEQLDAEIRRCAGVFECDCRGVGTDWSVEELRKISSALLGSVDIIPDAADMAADFAAMMRTAMGKAATGVVLRIALAPDTRLRFVRQVSPTVTDLTHRARPVDARTIDVPTGAWGTEARDYHVWIDVPEHAPGDELLAARVSLVVGGQPVSHSLVRATWTDDVKQSTRIDPTIAHYTGQSELATAIADGLSAASSGDRSSATERLGRAVSLAHAGGNSDTLELLSRVVEILDAPTGTVRLRASVAAADTMALDTRGTRTVRIRTVSDRHD